jgi:DNA-binding SARP family transcriptional activator/tetratricopeptide (TPR) repeat protein
VEFAILGPLEIHHGGSPVPLPGRTLPRLAAVLLLEAGQVVPLPKLVSAVWEDRPPSAARRRIQNSISDLRRVLADPGRALVESVGEGYRLRLVDRQLDALRFDKAVRGARRIAQDGDPAAALAGLREALRLWRGPALAGLTGRLIESGAQRWDEARLAAVEDRVDLELSLGGGPPLVGELRELLATQPYRQRMAGQLMMALYREGRIAEALETFDVFRTRLVEDLAMDPSQQLRDLHKAMLRQDPALSAPVPVVGIATAASTVVRPVVPVPAQLPAGTAHFTGRDDELAALDAALDDGASAAVVVAASGIGGAGKTALALHWAHRVRDRFPDGQLYANLRGYDRSGPAAASEVLAGFLGALGIPQDAIPPDVAQASALYRSLLADKKVLVILDNARDAGQVRPMLPATGGSCTIVTSRHQLAGLVALDDAHPITVGALPAAESLRLLGSLIGAGRFSAEPVAAQRLVELCAGLPLALRIAAANLVARPRSRLADAADALSGSDRLDRLAVADDPTATVAATFDLSYQAIEPAEQLLYLRLAFLPHQDIDRDLAVAISDESPADTDRLLARLEAAHRIEQFRPGRYRFHDLVREYARRKALAAFGEDARQRLRERVVDRYVRKSQVLALDEYDNVVAMFHEWGGYPTMSRLANVLTRFANHGHRLAELARLAERGMAIGGRSGDPMDFARPCNLMVAVSYALGDQRTAADYARRGLDAVGRTAEGDVTGFARANLGAALQELGRYLEAETLQREATHAAELSGDQHKLIVSLVLLGGINHRLGRFADAERHLGRAISLNESVTGGPHWAASVLSLADLRLDQGRTADAAGLYTDAAAILDVYPSHLNRIWLYLGQARLHRATGRYYTVARTLLTQALELALETSAKGYVFALQYELAELLCDFGQAAEAAGQVDRYAGETDRQHTPDTRAVRSRVLCKIHSRLGTHDRSVHFGRQACESFAAMPDPLRHAHSLVVLADAQAGAGDVEAAAAARKQALTIFTELGVAGAGQLVAMVDG